MVKDALYTFASASCSRFNKKLQSIFSTDAKLSVVHLRLLIKLLRAVCKVRKVFLSTLVPTLLLTTLTLARSSCASEYFISRIKQIRLINLCIFILYNSIYNIPCYFFFQFTFKNVFFAPFIKNSYFVCV